MLRPMCSVIASESVAICLRFLTEPVLSQCEVFGMTASVRLLRYRVYPEHFGFAQCKLRRRAHRSKFILFIGSELSYISSQTKLHFWLNNIESEYYRYSHQKGDIRLGDVRFCKLSVCNNYKLCSI